MVRLPQMILARDFRALIASLACLGALSIFAVRARVGLVTLEFGDETEKYVAAVMLRHGGRLYGDVFANHGPLAYVLAWAMTYITGQEDFTKARLVIVALALGACAAIATSPSLPRGAARAWAAALFLMPISALWFVHPLHMLIYHALGGYLMMIVIAQFTLPCISGAPIGPWNAGISGAAAVLAVTSAYPFAVSGVLFVVAGVAAHWPACGWHSVLRHAACFAIGALIAAVPMAIWITWKADWIGLFVYHFYFNQVIYGRMIGFSPFNVFNGLILSNDPRLRPHSLALVVGTIGIVGAIRLNVRRRLSQFFAVALMAFGILMLNPKGSPDFPDTAEMICCFGLLALIAGNWLASLRGCYFFAAWIAAGLFVAGTEVVARTALISPHGMKRSEAPIVFLRPDPADLVVQEVLRLTPPGETFLALPYWPSIYLYANRRPALANYYYLPFQAEYSKSPILHRNLNLCSEITKSFPKVIIVLSYQVSIWGSIFDYEPCLSHLLTAYYAPSKTISFVYERKF